MMNWENLTERQRLIAELSVYRNSQKDIANALDISVHTVNNVMQTVYRKTGRNEQELFLEYFGIDPASNPIRRYDIRPRLSTGRRVGALLLTAVVLTQIYMNTADMLRPATVRTPVPARIIRSRTGGGRRGREENAG